MLDQEKLKTFGAVLKALRLRHRLNQEEMAHALHVSRSYYSMIELGLKRPSIDFLLALRRAVRADLNQIFDDLNA